MKHVFSLLFLLTLSSALLAQSTNFTGNYAVNKSKIDFKDAPQSVLPNTYKVEQKGTQLTVTRTNINGAGTPLTFSESFSGDNAIAETTLPGGVKRKATLSWSKDQQSFTLSAVFENPEGHPGYTSITEVWSLTDEGKTLIVDRSVVQDNGLKYAIKAVYDKQ